MSGRLTIPKMALVAGWYLKRFNGNEEVVRLRTADTNPSPWVLFHQPVEGGYKVSATPDHRMADE